jgi:hypothetical protein
MTIDPFLTGKASLFQVPAGGTPWAPRIASNSPFSCPSNSFRQGGLVQLMRDHAQSLSIGISLRELRTIVRTNCSDRFVSVTRFESAQPCVAVA